MQSQKFPLEKIMSKTFDQRICPECSRAYPVDQQRCPEDGAELVLRPSVVQPGDLLDERYEILRPLGSGGMSEVYLARQIGLGQRVAIKILNERHASDVVFVKRFFREAKAVASLTHPNTIKIYDYGQTKQGQAYIAMEYVEGQTLANLLKAEKVLSCERAVHILAQICDSLSEAHNKGIIHRDLKPDNIYLQKTPGDPDFVKVLDFGIAKLIDDDQTRLTRTGAICGTPQYMSPEQVQSQNLTPQSDIYALGLILFEMLAGKPVFQDESPVGLMFKHVSEDPPSLPIETGDSERIGNIIRASLQKDPKKRPQGVLEFKQLIGLATVLKKDEINTPKKIESKTNANNNDQNAKIEYSSLNSKKNIQSKEKFWANNRLFIWSFIAFSFIFVLSVHSIGGGNASDNKDNFLLHGGKKYVPGKDVEYFEDKGGELELIDIISNEKFIDFKKNDSELVNFGYTKSAFWVKIKWNGNDVRYKNLILDVQSAILDSIEFYQKIDDKWNEIKTGDSLEFDSRDVNHHNFVFRVVNQENENLILLKVSSNTSIILPMILWEEEAFHDNDQMSTAIDGIYYGIMFAMILYNLFLFLSLGDIVYLFYLLYVV